MPFVRRERDARRRPHHRRGTHGRRTCGPLGWYDLSTLKEPYRVEGKKTMGYEIAEQSCTSGKAGGLICEPLKAVWPATPARFLFEHLQLIESTIFFLLLSDVISHLHLVPPHRRHVIAPRPKIQPNKVLRLDVPHHPGYRILRRDRQHHVNMIAHQMPFGMNTT